MEEENNKKKIQDIIPPKTAREEEEDEDIEDMEIALEEEPETQEELRPQPEEPVKQPKKEKPKKLKKEPVFFEQEPFIHSKPKKKLITKKNLIIAGVIFLAVCGIILYFSLGRAEIILHPKTETMEFTTEINLKENAGFIDLATSIIPAQTFQTEKTKEREFPSTKEKQVEKKAKGVIKIYNQYSSKPQTLVENTRFISENGKVFKTIKTITVPGAAIEEGKIIPNSIEVEVRASEPGKEYNIGPTTFNIPGFKGTAKYDDFYGESTGPMTGGVIGKVKVASEEDIKGAKQVLTEELKSEVKKEIQKSASDNLNILEDATLIEVTSSTSSVEPGDPAEKFKITVTVSGKILAFNEEDAISLINDNLKEKIDENKKIIKDSISIDYKLQDINLNEGRAKLVCKVKEDIAWKIDTDKIKQDLAGKKEIEVRKYLSSQSKIESAKVIFWPFWVKRIPSDKEKIKINTQVVD